MPQIDFDAKHKRTSSDTLDFDRLKLKKDERARIVILEPATFAYCHTLKAPKIVNGKATKVEKKTRRGDVYMDFDMDFIGRPLCLGDPGILNDKGVDAANCPVCKRSTETDEVNPPERRFAANVIRYTMNREGKLVQPFSCTCVVWSFTEGIYNRLADIAAEHGSPIGRDLLLGPCTDEGFQKYEIQAGAQSLWQASDDIKRTVQATFDANKVEDLERACGRKAETRWLVKDLDNIAERWRIARGEKDGTEAVMTAGLDEGLNDLLGTTPKQDPVDVAGLLDNPTAAHNPPKPAPAVDQKSDNKPFDFTSIMDGLG